MAFFPQQNLPQKDKNYKKTNFPIIENTNFGLFRAGVIYSLSCPDTSIVKYIGKTFNPTKRFYAHFYHAKRQKRNKKNLWILDLINNNKLPTIEIIDDCDEFNWQEKEIAYIKLYKSCGALLLNSTNGGESGWPIHLKRSDKTKEAISKANKGIIRTDEWKKNISEGKKRKYENDPESKNHISKLGTERLINFYKNITPEQKQKIKWAAKIASRGRARFNFCDLIKVMILNKTNNNPIYSNLNSVGITRNDYDNLRRMYLNKRRHA